MKKWPFVVAFASIGGCSPVIHESCAMPDFTRNLGLEVHRTFATWGYFSERCPEAIPKQFVVERPSASLAVRIEGEWLRVSSQARSGAALQLRGSNILRGSNVRVDKLQNHTLEL